MFTAPVCHLGKGKGEKAVEFTYGGYLLSYSQTLTFSNVPIGEAANDRVVVVCFNTGRPSGNSISSVTIGGVTATIAIQYYNGLGTMHGIAYATVPAGITADIVITASGSLGDIKNDIAVYALYNLESEVAYSSTYDITYSYSISVTAPEKSIVISSCATFKNGGTTVSWSGTAGVSEDYDQTTTYTGGLSSAHVLSEDALSAATVNATPAQVNANSQMLIVFN